MFLCVSSPHLLALRVNVMLPHIVVVSAVKRVQNSMLLKCLDDGIRDIKGGKRGHGSMHSAGDWGGVEGQ